MNPLAVRFHDACLSALQLDRVALGEEESAHVRGCALCTREIAARRTAQAEALPPLRAVEDAAGSLRAAKAVGTWPGAAEAVAAPRRGRPARRWAWATAAGGLAAAASLLLVARPTERTKGAPFSLGMYVQHGADVRRAAPGEAVAPGDALRFAVTAPQGGFLAVLSLDAGGAASVYFPQGPRAARIDPGAAELALPLSTRLDATLGDERILGLLCDAPVELEPLRVLLQRGALDLPAGCQVTRWSFVKR